MKADRPELDREAPGRSGDIPVTGPGPEPALAQRLARSGVPASAESTGRATNQVLDNQETGLPEDIREGDESAPRTGRVDAAGATFGPDASRERIAQVPGGGPVESVGGAMSDDRQSDDDEAGER